MGLFNKEESLESILGVFTKVSDRLSLFMDRKSEESRLNTETIKELELANASVESELAEARGVHERMGELIGKGTKV